MNNLCPHCNNGLLMSVSLSDHLNGSVTCNNRFCLYKPGFDSKVNTNRPSPNIKELKPNNPNIMEKTSFYSTRKRSQLDKDHSTPETTISNII